MMVEYKQYDNQQYDEKITSMLRRYNAKFSDNKTYSKLYFYALNNDVLVGALEVSYFWDWLSVDNVFYENIDVLNALINAAWNAYKDKVQGFKFFTTVESQYKAFIKVGFTLSKTVKTTNVETYYYLHYVGNDLKINDEYAVICMKEPVLHYQNQLKASVQDFNTTHNISGISDRFNMAALINNRCVGGIVCEGYGHMLYISRLVVDKKHRNQSIGKNLTLRALGYAKEKGYEYVMLGTCEFQAKGFYEKIGFHVVFIRENNPINYKSYTMLKYL